jgi:hypothetical protein
MKLLKQAMAVLGTVVVIAVLVALVTPKTAHAIVATMVQVVNTAAQPVPTWGTDNDGRSAVRLSYYETMAAGDTFSNGKPLFDATTSAAFTVPAGKRLVVDSLSLFAYPISGQNVFVYLWNGHSYTALPAIGQGTFFGFDYFQNAIQVRDYVDAGGQYLVTMTRNGATGAMVWDVHAAGHLVDCTSGGGC